MANRSDISTYQVIKEEKKILGDVCEVLLLHGKVLTDVCELIKKADLTEKDLLLLLK